ncbi:MAG TPA: septum formation initiator family protein [Xanthobacteraceae bacterium]|nr:septum formation initiator family protein [Xanthobacteraceae bacterium]
MVTRPRIRSILTALALYAIAGTLIVYFGINAYTGNLGLRARQDIDARIAELTQERDRLRTDREQWQHKVDLLKPDRLDPDLLDERARALLNYAHPRDAIMLVRKP